MTAPAPSQPPEDRPLLPDRAAEDCDEAWGQRPDGSDEDRLERERPPHHDGHSSY